MQKFGKIIFKIDQVLEEKNISKNKLEKENYMKSLPYGDRIDG